MIYITVKIYDKSEENNESQMGDSSVMDVKFGHKMKNKSYMIKFL